MNRIARSLLFVPGDRPERFAKAAASGAHEVVLDLEDAVAPASKGQAREAVSAWLAHGHRAMVRINAADAAWYEDDLKMLQSMPHAGVVLPKADEASLARTLQILPGRRVIALLETVHGYMGLMALAGVAGLERIAFGSVDFAVESGIADEGDAMTAVRTQIVLASCHAGLAPPIDGVSLELTDEEGMRTDALRSRQLGFGGKLCIHPRQVAMVNAAWQPTPSEQAWAQRVLAASEASGGAATAVDGKMIDKPVVERARRIVAECKIIDNA
ncbi:HpcH/HpaI aldolase/citrate lyase family protein [Paralcaligenes ureilyticus]|uniref:Citrate lyase subunit beta/citryl-CoA lyase n=1 Tax=Paralcaligenes ureilyticus TaxID=627131 RepID=A0A4R3MD93_9BURK|nr:CoA ester lyase [Paralcaligenes ureilyticus]TCT11102.1 citrate lyase subunit beta/citryl-CoA lyase [Paralcaligenes ureilyticus]